MAQGKGLVFREQFAAKIAAGDLVLPNTEVRRLLALPGRGSFGDERILTAFSESPLGEYLSRYECRPASETIHLGAAPAAPSLPDGLEWSLRGTTIARLGADPNRRRMALEAWAWRDVFYARSNFRWAIFGTDWIDPRSTGIPGPAAIEAARSGNTEGVEALHDCGDVYSADNPGHFITDHLTRAIQFRDEMGAAPEEIFLPDHSAPICRTASATVVPGARRIRSDRVYRCRKLVLLNSVEFATHPFHHTDPAILQQIADPLRHAAADWSNRGRAVYLTRRGHGRRPLEAEADLAGKLDAAGCTTIDMADLSGQDQFGVVHHADLIVAPHGGALGALIAARPGTRVIELISPMNGTVAYALTARALGLDYSLMVGRSTDESDGWRIDHGAVISAVTAGRA